MNLEQLKVKVMDRFGISSEEFDALVTHFPDGVSWNPSLRFVIKCGGILPSNSRREWDFLQSEEYTVWANGNGTLTLEKVSR